jgi:hypothetical protein
VVLVAVELEQTHKEHQELMLLVVVEEEVREIIQLQKLIMVAVPVVPES